MNKSLKRITETCQALILALGTGIYARDAHLAANESGGVEETPEEITEEVIIEDTFRRNTC